MSPSPEFEIIPATKEDENRIFEFLVESFYPDEPLNSSIGRIPKTAEECPSLKHLDENYSYMAVQKSNPGVIWGVVINKEFNSHDSSWRKVTEQHASTPYGEIARLLKNTSEKLDIILENYKNNENDRTLYTCVLAISKSARRQRLGLQLMTKSMEIARQKDFAVLALECTSAYSARLSEKMGYHAVYTLKYEDYRDEHSSVIFQTHDPHTSITAYLKYTSDEHK